MTEEDITRGRILNIFHTVAVVGLSPDRTKPSNEVARYLIDHGYDVIPVNPTAQEILGKTSYSTLSAVPQPIEIVDIFRASDKVGPIVEEAIKIKAKVVWMQEGVINEEAATKARAAGLMVVMDRCIKKDHMRLIHGQEPYEEEDE
jgi:predicted CoA-binding protein